MDGQSQFMRVSLSKERNFSWVFLVDWALLCVVSLTVIFYLGRLFAYGLTLLLDWLLWRRWNVKVSVESIRIAPLSGSILFRNLCIIDRDHTISILKGSITWRYWELATRRSQYEALQRGVSAGGEEEDVNTMKNLKLPCRFLVSCEGFEIFMYNRTVAYENIIKMFSKDEKIQFEKFLDDQQISQLTNLDTDTTGDKDLTESLPSSSASDTTTMNDRIFDEVYVKQKSLFMRFLPLEVDLHKGTFVLGNKFTPTLLIASYNNAQGMVDLCLPNEKLDLYKMKFQVDFTDVDVSIKQNIAYDRKKTKFKNGKMSKLWGRFLKSVYFPLIGNRLGKGRLDEDHFIRNWKGLSLYKGQTTTQDQEYLDNLRYDFANHEYAKVSSIIKSPKTVVTYEYDIPGIVPHGAHATLDGPDVGNSGAPPEFAVDLHFHGATLSYGPWAQRQIQHLQRLLSPIVAKSSKPVKTLSPGSRRIYTVFKTTFAVSEDSTWRIPTRERSKDQDFLKHFRETAENYRAFGWLDLKFGPESFGSITTILCPTKEGFPNKMNIHFADMEANSSVNHDMMLKCKYFDVFGDIGYPLGWNSDATWLVDLSSSQLETFLLREHITLMADIFSDFASGDPTPYELFRPFIYQIKWAISGYSLYLNVNDHNIVNNPLDFNENCYLSLHGEDLAIDVTVPNDTITGISTEVTYQISTSMFRLLLNTPPWNTLNEFMANKEVGRSYDFAVNGVYTFFSELDIDNVDTISVECTSTGTTLHCYGFVIRYLMNVKMNYFGDFFNFITSEEYTGVIRAKETQNLAKMEHESVKYSSTIDSSDSEQQTEGIRTDPPVKRSAVKRSTNETDIWFVFSVWEGALVLPETIYNCDPCVVLHFGELVVDLRSCNYYMDLLATMNNTSIKRYVSRQPHELFELIRKSNGRYEQEHGSLATLTIHGHRMYGLPPTEPTYFCQWGIDVNSLNVCSDTEFAKGFFTLFGGIAFGYSNLENTLLYDMETPDDMTSVTVRAQNMDFVISDDHSKLQAAISVPSVTFTSIDFENEKYSQRIDVKIPSMNIELRSLSSGEVSESLFSLRSKLYFTTFIQRKDFAEHREKQRDYIALNDSPFYRCSFLLPCYLQESPLYKELLGSISPSSSLPPLPLPLLPETIDFIVEDLLGEFAAALKCDYDNQEPFNSPEALTPPFNRSDSSLEEPDWRGRKLPMHLSPDPLNHYNNIILNVDFITVEANPSLCSHIVGFLGDFWRVDIVDVIDEIEMSIVKRLGHLRSGDSICNLKVFIVDINIFWGERMAKGLEVYFDKFDLEIGQRTRDMDGEVVVDEVFTLSKLRSLRATVFDRSITEGAEERPPALSLAVEGWEAYSSKRDSLVWVVSLLSTDVTVDESQLKWLALYVNEQKDAFTAMMTSFKEMHEYWKGVRKEMLCSITAASEFYRISHDPYVITKPAFIMRLSDGHVRENRSWRIITRLRHILTYLPADWQANSQFQKSQQQSSTGAEDVFVSIFSNWRSWELSDVTRSYIYRTIFLPNEHEMSFILMKKVLKVNFHSFFFTVYSEGYRVAHNFVITRANIAAEKLFDEQSSAAHPLIKCEQTINVTVSLGALKGELSEQLLRFYGSFQRHESEQGHSNTASATPSNYKINLLLAFDRSELLFVLTKTRLTNRVINGKVTVLLEKLKDSATPALSVALYAKRSESWLKHGDAILAEALSREICMTATAELWSHAVSLIVNAQCSDSHFRAMASTELVTRSVDEILVSVSKVKQEMGFEETCSKAKEKKTDLSRRLLDTAITFNFNNLTAEIMVLSPFLLRFEMRQLSVYLNKLERNGLLISMWDSSIFLKSHQTTEQYFNFALGDLQIKFDLPTDSNAELDIGISTSLMKLTLSEPRRILSSFLQDEKLVGESLCHTRSLFSKYSPAAQKATAPKFTKWALDANLNYFGILIPISSTFFVFELHMLLAAFGNRNRENGSGSPVLGQLSVENCLLLIKDPILPVELSKLVDFSIRVATSQKVADSPQSYQIESSHFRLCLAPQSLVQVLWGAHQMQGLFLYFKKHRKEGSVPLPFLTSEHKGTKELPIDFRSIHILSYNLCIGWMFQVDGGVESGLILGFDRLFSAYEKNYGKLTLIDGYLSVANGNSTDTFYSKGNERMGYNRSFLSNVQVSYWLKEACSMKDLFIRVKGEALDVNYLSTSMSIIEGTLASMHKFQALKKERMQHSNEFAERKGDSENAAYDISPFLSHIRTIDCQFNYVGGIFKVYSPDDLTRNEGPSLEIRSPGVKVALKYEHNASEDKPHWVRCLVTIDPTHNILYSRCVPILSDFAETTQCLIQKHTPDELPNENSQGTDYIGLLDAFDIAFKVESGKQQLSLSCEPRAKVQADVGFDSFTFGVITNDSLTDKPLGVSLSVEKIRSSIRHIFSRETSASFSIDFFDLTSIFSRPNIYAVALVSDINVFFNIKQLQNLNLFLDIWRLNGKLSARTQQKNEETKPAKTLAADRKKTKSDINFSFTIIFNQIDGDINLGPSLGVLSLQLGRAWFATDHFGGQKQVLHAFADKMCIKSEGRFSGLLMMEDAIWVSEVNWPDVEPIKANPEMSLSLGIGSVAFKAAFDYHMFLIGTIDQIKFKLRSESDLYGVLPDLLVVSLSCTEMNFCATALTAANILDIYNTIVRTRQDNRISYAETLRESNTVEGKVTVLYEDILESLNLLRTDLSVDVSTFKAQISPISLFDVEVLVLSIENVCARSETKSGAKLKTELHLQFFNAKVSLTTSREELDEDIVSKISIEDYMLYAAKIKGGTIANIPRLLVSMTTWQKPKSGVIEYLFTCRFFDRVAVKWNLGPINFIKEMWSTHLRSIAVRQTQSREHAKLGGKEQPVSETEAEKDSKFQYVPLDEPYIEMPQIKDLGDATPPIEWFGVHRKYLPAATHQMAIILIQKLVHAAEKEYAKALG